MKKVFKDSFEDFLYMYNCEHWRYNYEPPYTYRKGDYCIVEISPAEFFDEPDILFTDDPDTIADYIKGYEIDGDPDEPVVGLVVEEGVPTTLLTTEPDWIYAIFRRVNDNNWVGDRLFLTEEEARQYIDECLEE